MTPIVSHVRAFLKDLGFSGVSEEDHLTNAEQTEFRSQACTFYGADPGVFPTCFTMPDLLPTSLWGLLQSYLAEPPELEPKVVENAPEEPGAVEMPPDTKPASAQVGALNKMADDAAKLGLDY